MPIFNAVKRLLAMDDYWITIGSEKFTDGKNRGGSRVLIEGERPPKGEKHTGKIIGGIGGKVKGKTIGEFIETAREERASKRSGKNAQTKPTPESVKAYFNGSGTAEEKEALVRKYDSEAYSINSQIDRINRKRVLTKEDEKELADLNKKRIEAEELANLYHTEWLTWKRENKVPDESRPPEKEGFIGHWSIDPVTGEKNAQYIPDPDYKKPDTGTNTETSRAGSTPIMPAKLNNRGIVSFSGDYRIERADAFGDDCYRVIWGHNDLDAIYGGYNDEIYYGGYKTLAGAFKKVKKLVGGEPQILSVEGGEGEMFPTQKEKIEEKGRTDGRSKPVTVDPPSEVNGDILGKLTSLGGNRWTKEIDGKTYDRMYFNLSAVKGKLDYNDVQRFKSAYGKVFYDFADNQFHVKGKGLVDSAKTSILKAFNDLLSGSAGTGTVTPPPDQKKPPQPPKPEDKPKSTKSLDWSKALPGLKELPKFGAKYTDSRTGPAARTGWELAKNFTDDFKRDNIDGKSKFTISDIDNLTNKFKAEVARREKEFNSLKESADTDYKKSQLEKLEAVFEAFKSHTSYSENPAYKLEKEFRSCMESIAVGEKPGGESRFILSSADEPGYYGFLAEVGEKIGKPYIRSYDDYLAYERELLSLEKEREKTDPDLKAENDWRRSASGVLKSGPTHGKSLSKKVEKANKDLFNSEAEDILNTSETDHLRSQKWYRTDWNGEKRWTGERIYPGDKKKQEIINSLESSGNYKNREELIQKGTKALEKERQSALNLLDKARKRAKEFPENPYVQAKLKEIEDDISNYDRQMTNFERTLKYSKVPGETGNNFGVEYHRNQVNNRNLSRSKYEPQMALNDLDRAEELFNKALETYGEKGFATGYVKDFQRWAKRKRAFLESKISGAHDSTPFRFNAAWAYLDQLVQDSKPRYVYGAVRNLLSNLSRAV